MDKFLKAILLSGLIIFLVMFFSSGSSYYEYELGKKTILTSDAIEKFEQDVKDGKEIDLNDYYVTKQKDYNNNFSNTGITLSNKIEKLFSEGVKFIFNSIGELVEK